MRRDVTWRIYGGAVLGPAPFFVTGIVNATPDSFYDGGLHAGADQAVAHGLKLLEEGANILDVGGESTRPFADPVDAETERARVIPVIEALAGTVREHPGTAISVDTYKGEIAAEAIRAGAGIVNDVSACLFDPSLLDVVGGEKPGYVLMHSLGKPTEMQVAPQYENVVDEIMAFFEERLSALTSAGLPEQNIVLDPGIGFGKTREHNLEIMRGIERFHGFGLPLYIGISNKSIWDKLLGLDKDKRGPANIASTVLLAERGVAVHRVHEVSAAVQALKILEQIAPTGSDSGSEVGADA